MFHASERLPHLLPPQSYCSEAAFEEEQVKVFRRSWHFVGIKSDFAKHGDFVTVEVCGEPIQVRNNDGTIHAVSNVCAHRHCLLTSEPRGCSSAIRCQYHGWEYTPNGASSRIPLAQHFAPLNRDSIRIGTYRVATLGQLVFVNLDPSAAGLEEFLGDSLPAARQGFEEGWHLTLCQKISQPVNWKIPIENSLEAYHVPAVHPETFKSDPGEDRSSHIFHACGSWLAATLPFSTSSVVDRRFQNAERLVTKVFCGREATDGYQQHHVHPNVLFSFTDMISLLHVVRPDSATTCTSIVYQFGRPGKSAFFRLLTRMWGKITALVTLRILKEDFHLYPSIQRGLIASRQPGMIGRCEERIHSFQKWMNDRCAFDSCRQQSVNNVTRDSHNIGTPGQVEPISD